MQKERSKIEIDYANCVGCKMCIACCPEDVYKWDKAANHAIPAHTEDCALCYQCEMYCKGKCIEVIPLRKQIKDVVEIRALRESAT